LKDFLHACETTHEGLASQHISNRENKVWLKLYWNSLFFLCNNQGYSSWRNEFYV